MKNNFLEALKEVDNFTFTENGAIALNSTTNPVLDAFGSLAAMKDSSAEQILTTFYKAFLFDQKLAMRLLFYVRDIRGGQGMRRVFRVIIRSLAFEHSELVTANFDNFLFFGRGDDLMCLVDTPCEKAMMEYCRKVLLEDFKSLNNGGSCSLLAKWMPSENTSSNESKRLAKKFIKYFETSAKEYRKMLTALRREIDIVEAKMSANEWDKIDFEKLPSRASMIYSDAFVRHSLEEYTNYLNKVANGEAKINAGALFPVNIIHNVMERGGYGYWGSPKVSLKDKLLYDAMWKALPDYFEGKEETGICVVDVSGSMSGTPMEVAISLGLYCADKCKGPFKNHFITFSANPKLQEVQGENIFDKVRTTSQADWGQNTDLEKVFDLILEAAVRNNLPQEDLPSKLYIISDMQFDQASGQTDGWMTKGKKITFMDSMKQKFIDAGYVMPAIVYWNVRACDCGMFQETVDGENCCMVSGYSPSLFKSVIDGTEFVEIVNDKGKKVVEQKLDPLTIMLTTLNNERYDRVIAQ